ncbi:WD40 repeat-like protein [Neolentinus lepideus HHB14362 ss-1]|uniref:WD40 repeat-like protein n=1 Tax=Neolentinus lepideus HHB14362 ss-1 TaxID=1314782 RepID=A0A165UG14_9AGAM|nr:WD40 repeat-like protein [Neolentinus lepideus HHB14362 ss-1]
MVALSDPTSVKVYTVNGASSSTSSSLPDWLTRKRQAKGKGKRAVKEQFEGTIELIQHFEFPEASNRVKTTRDGRHAIATGTYKPHMKVWDLDELALKFERHSDVENVDFVILSDDWTKTLHLQADRSIELHTQSGFHYRTRIPRFGRAVQYHYPSCDAIFGAAGNEVYRLNLDQGRFLNPLVLQGTDGSGGGIEGVNAIDINPAHQLFGFGIDGNGTVEFWDPRSRSRVGLLHLPHNRLIPTYAAPTLPGVDDASTLSVTSISSRSDGLSYAVGTSTGHTLLYDIRSARPFALKDQGYGLPVRNVSWVEGGSRMAGDGLVVSADKKVIKIWDRNEPSSNFASITPATDINDVHHIPGSGLLMVANEGIKMTTYYIPQLGPAPRWCSFLENITEELEDQTTRTIYEDFKFVEKSELESLGLSHLIGTAALKPYMHGYFLSLKLYDAARVIANPFAYAEHRERVVKEKMEKMAETRIRTRKDQVGVKVNKKLAERVMREEERNKRKEERKKKKAVKEAEDEEMSVVEEEEKGDAGRPNLLSDPRFKSLFEDPEFEVNEDSREFALANPVAAMRRRTEGERNAKESKSGRRKTAVEEEEEESEKGSSDSEDEDKEESEDSDNDDLRTGSRISRHAEQALRMSDVSQSQRRKNPSVRMVPMRAQADGHHAPDKGASFGQRRSGKALSSKSGKHKDTHDSTYMNRTADGGLEMSWVPSGSSEAKDRAEQKKSAAKKKDMFGHGMERGGEEREVNMSESERSGRKHRRHGMRSGSKNTFRRM